MKLARKLGLMCPMLMVIGLILAMQSPAEIDKGTIVGAWLFEEGNGDIAGDSSGNGYDGELAEGPEWVEGTFGKALEFDGQESRVDCGDVDALDFGLSDFTICLWIKAAASGAGEVGNGWSRIVDKHFIGGFSLMRSGGGSRVQFEVNGNAVTTISAKPAFDDTWHHITAIRYDDTRSRIYIDGALDIEGNLVGGNLENDIPFRMGYDDPGFGGRMKCVLDEVAIFNVALAEDDINTVMTEGLAGMLSVYPAYRLALSWGAVKTQ